MLSYRTCPVTAYCGPLIAGRSMMATVKGAPLSPSIFRLLNGASREGGSTAPACSFPSRCNRSQRISRTCAETTADAIGRLSSTSIAPRAIEIFLIRGKQGFERLRIDPSLRVLSAQDALELAVNIGAVDDSDSGDE